LQVMKAIIIIICNVNDLNLRHDSFICVWYNAFIRVRYDSFIRVQHDSLIHVWYDWFAHAP